MKRINRILAALAIAVLIGTLSLLSWLRTVTANDMQRAIDYTKGTLRAGEILHGPGGNRLVNFAALERAAELAKQSPYFEDVRITKLVGNEEFPVVSYKLLADQPEGRNWRDDDNMKAWNRVPLLDDSGSPFGYLYIKEKLGVQKTLNWSIGMTSIAIVLMLVTLLARLWSQETSLTRTMVELGERKQELIRVERLALAGQLAAGLLHDLRKPVLNIQHSIDELGDALGDFAPAAPALQDQRRQTKLFFQILSDSQMERFVQSDRAGAEYLDIVPLIDFAINLVRYERRAVEIIRREDDNLPPILAQPFRLIQLFSNLIMNGYQAMSGQGRLTIEAAQVASPAQGRPHARNSKPASPGIEVRIIDSGPGISAENLERIFDPFFTTKPEGQGTGLGLSISRMIVEELGGTIKAQNNPTGGATFKVWLPAELEPVANES